MFYGVIKPILSSQDQDQVVVRVVTGTGALLSALYTSLFTSLFTSLYSRAQSLGFSVTLSRPGSTDSPALPLSPLSSDSGQ